MQIREYTKVLRERWWVILLTALIAATTAFAFARSQTPIFRSSVKLEVTGRIDYGQILAIGQLLRQIAARVETTAVASTVDERLRLDLGTDALLAKIHTQAFPDTIQIQIDVDDVDPARAEQIAFTLATVVKERQDALMAPVPQQERINLGIVDRPSAPRLFWPQTRILVLAAGLLGLVVGVILAFFLDYLDDTLKDPEEVERHLALPILGLVPVASAGDAPAASVASVRQIASRTDDRDLSPDVSSVPR
jgi:capsular polysaccharide biosynthesis protein